MSNETSDLFKGIHQKLFLKYLLDKLFALFCLIVASPLILIGIILIKIDGILHPENAGNIFYGEERYTQGKPFKIYKFRTVTQKQVDEIEKSGGTKSITGSDNQTWAGGIILKWYLDELPQLFCILIGDMSFVGPRPHVKYQHEGELAAGLEYRRHLRAGLLGIPQACKRNPKYAKILMKMAKSQKSDMEMLKTLDGIYVEKILRGNIFQILWFDLVLIVKGLWVVVRGENADLIE